METYNDQDFARNIEQSAACGILMYRKMLETALDDVEAGRDPMNVFRAPVSRIDLPVERSKLGGAIGNFVTGDRSGNTVKYSPLLKQQDAALAPALPGE